MLVANRSRQGEQAPPPSAPPASVSPARPAEPAGGSKPVWAVTALAALVVAALVVASRLGRARGDGDGPLGDDGASAAPPVAAMADAFAASLDDLLAEPDPRRAVIAAYARLLAALDRCGLGRRPSEAPEEHLRRALAVVAVPAAPLERLVALFTEARFSDHALGQEQRDAAIDAFRAARDDLRPHARMEP
jgi:hypothetical protein